MTLRRLILLMAAALALAAPAGAHASATPRIVGGGTATTASWPSTVWLLGERDRDGDGELDPDFSCTGSVIAASWVLTAAHCVLADPEFPTKGTEPAMTVVLGAANYNDPAAKHIQASELIPDPDYFVGQVPHNDIALVHLSTPTTQPRIALAQTGITYNSPNNVANAAGWGRIDVDSTSDTPVLQQAWLPLQAPSSCQSLMPGFDGATMVCAGNPGVAGLCHGDSGGPIVVLDPTSNQPVLWGVASWIVVQDPPCALNHPAAYTWVPAYQAFIQKHLYPSVAPPASPTTPVTPPAPAPVAPAPSGPVVPAAPAAPDHTKPVLTAVTLSSYHFRAARGGATIASIGGATIGYRLSEAAKIYVTVERPKTVRHRVVFKALKPIASIVGRAGNNKSLFSARLGGRRLPAASYRLSLQAVDAAGNRSGVVRLPFRVVKG